MRRYAGTGRRFLALMMTVCLAGNSGMAVQGASTSEEMSEREKRNAALSMEAAMQGMVLLENEDGALPIVSEESLALFGGGAVRTAKGGTGSGDVNQRYAVSIWEGFKNVGFQITTSDWLNGYEEMCERKKAEFDGGFGMPFYVEEPELTDEDVEEARLDGETKTAVYVITRTSGEGADRAGEAGDYYLTDAEERNLQKLASSFEKTIVLLNVGGVIDTGFFDEIDGLDAMLLMSQAGMEGGNAVAKVLAGEECPSGKLTDTWPQDYSDYPSADSFGANDKAVDQENYTEGIYVGYRYFDTFGITPSYPFGYGLSYTDFSIEPEEATAGPEEITVTALVTNTGDTYAGKEVVQVYFSAPEGLLEKPYQELAAYTKTGTLKPGESERVTLHFPTADMASYSVEHAAYLLEKGDYILRIGNSSRNTKAAAVIHLDETVVTEQLSNQMEPVQEAELLSREGVSPYTYEEEEQEIAEAWELVLDAGKIETVNHASVYEDEKVTAYVSDTTQTQYLAENLPYVLENPYHGAYEEEVVYLEGDFSKSTLIDVYNGEVSLEEFVSGLTVSEMADLVIGGSKLPNASGQSAGAQSDNLAEVSSEAIAKAQENSVQGAAGETAGLYIESKKIPNIILADGPAGLRLTRDYEAEDGREYYQFCTAWPIGTLLASTWDTELMEQVGAAMGEELSEYGVTMLLAPGMNIHRNALCGRNFEYYSEDPYLSGTMGGAETQGLQSVPGIGACIKHFAVNSQEVNRTAVNNNVDERTLREIYLKGFEIAVKMSQPMGVMSSYNQNNGVPAGDDYDLLTNILRGEWGFEGLVMTDWGGGQSTPSVSLHAGNDLIMPGNSVEDITVRGFSDEEPEFGADGIYPEVTIEQGWYWLAGYRMNTDWGEFTPDTSGDETITRTVKTAVYEKAQRDVVNENGEVITKKVSELLADLGGSALAQDNGDGTTTITYRGTYRKNNITLGDLQKSVMNILRVVMKSGQFEELLTEK